ncbi:MAG: neutral/alkaline non-lysosomal ceramidase N-terminal domain-containing protein [Armatimonadia bacterium]
MSTPNLTAGAARVDITPPLTIPELGFLPARHTFFKGVHDPLYARALVVGDGAARVAVVVADAIGLKRTLFGDGRDFIAEVRQRAAALTGIAPDHLMVAATHAHSTPETMGSRPLTAHPGGLQWLEALADQLASAVAQADAAREPVCLKQATGRADGISCCRRVIGKDGKLYHYSNRPPDDQVADWGQTDPTVTVLRLQTMDGKPKTAILHFTAHPVTVQVNELISADYPGAAVAHVEGAGVGCDSLLFLQGACGNINPIRGTSGFDDVAVYGQVLGDETIRLLALSASTDYPTASDCIASATVPLSLPSASVPDLADLERQLAGREDELRSATTDQQRTAAQSAIYLLQEHIARAQYGSAPFQAEVQALRIGDTVLIGVPVEPFVELGLAIRALADRLTCLCIGYANDYLGYVGPPEAWKQGGYEFGLGTWAYLGPDAYHMLLQAAQQAVQLVTSG